MLQQHLRQPATMLARLETGLALIEAHQLGTFPHWMMSLRGWLQAEEGNVGEGMAQLHASIERARQMGIRNLECFYLGLLAEQYGRQGDFVQGLSLLDETLAQMSQHGGHWREADAYRYKGELLIQWRGSDHEGAAAAEAMFLQAIGIAQCQEAKALELRAAVRLARLWQGAGRDAEARQLLTPIHAWFTEGFDTPDLIEAKL